MTEANNPLLQPWTHPQGLPPFALVQPEHFEPAFGVAMREEMAQVEAIANQAEPPTFANTVQAFDRCGRLLTRTELLFQNLTYSHTNPALQAVQRAMAPRLAARPRRCAWRIRRFSPPANRSRVWPRP